MIKTIILSAGLLIGALISPLRADVTDIFKENEGLWLDWAIASSVETVYYRDFLHGRNGVGGGIPIFFLAKYISGNLGYVSFYEETQRGSLAPGVSVRLNKIIKDLIEPDKMESLKALVPNQQALLDKLFIGAWYSYLTTQEEHAAGIKAGFQF